MFNGRIDSFLILHQVHGYETFNLSMHLYHLSWPEQDHILELCDHDFIERYRFHVFIEQGLYLGVARLMIRWSIKSSLIVLSMWNHSSILYRNHMPKILLTTSVLRFWWSIASFVDFNNQVEGNFQKWLSLLFQLPNSYIFIYLVEISLPGIRNSPHP